MDFHIDAKNKKFGRVASEIAQVLQGKKTPDYDPSMVGKDKVYLKNWNAIEISGNKAEQKVYYRHTGYVGHLKEATFKEAWTKDPKKVIRDAVSHMLPKNFLNARRMKNLIFVEE
jgi:large subunit ribosomal protein L13